MKKYFNFIKEELEIDKLNDIKILDLSYYDIIDLCDMDITIDNSFKDKYDFGFCDYVNKIRDNKEYYTSYDFRYLIGIKNEELYSFFYKQIGTTNDIYGDGYIISKGGFAYNMFNYMKTLGNFTTFSNLENIPSIKSQLKSNAEIITISSYLPGNTNTKYINKIDDNIFNLLKDEKIYYKDIFTNETFYFIDKNDNLKLNKLSNFILEHERIKLIYPDNLDKSGLQIYFHF